MKLKITNWPDQITKSLGVLTVLFLALWLLQITGCSSIQYAGLEGDRNCLVNAIGFQDAYNADRRFDGHRWSKILGIFWDDERRIGHAVCIFEQWGELWAYDKEKGQWRVTTDLALKDNPRALAELWSPKTAIREAYFFEDIPRPLPVIKPGGKHPVLSLIFTDI
jgi:hypothetical protein